MKAARDRREVGDVERVRVVAAEPAGHVERVRLVGIAGQAGGSTDQHLDVAALFQQRALRAPQVEFRIGGFLVVLAVLRQVATRRADMTGRLENQRVERAFGARQPAVSGRFRHDHVVAFDYIDDAKYGFEACAAVVDED